MRRHNPKHAKFDTEWNFDFHLKNYGVFLYVPFNISDLILSDFDEREEVKLVCHIDGRKYTNVE
jgi:hypothetical protein